LAANDVPTAPRHDESRVPVRPVTSEPSTSKASPEVNDGWWTGLGLRWGLIFSLAESYRLYLGGNWGLRWAHLFDDWLFWILVTPGSIGAPYWRSVGVALTWLYSVGLPNPGNGYRPVLVSVLGSVPPALIWMFWNRRRPRNETLREVLSLAVRYSLAIAMILYGSSKVLGRQGFPQPNPLEWIRPLGEISTGQLMWTWLGYSGAFQFFAGVNELVGGILLLFRRTTLLGALLVLPVMIYVTALDVTFEVGPRVYAALFAAWAFYLVAIEWRRLAAVFIFGQPTAPPPPRTVWTSPRLIVAGRGIWVLTVAFALWSYPYAMYKELADVGGRMSPLCGAYVVERFEIDGRVVPTQTAPATRWREVAISWYGDYVRVRRMDDAELLWAADPGDAYRFMVTSGHDYRFGDYAKLLAKTADVRTALRFRELPNVRAPEGPRSQEFFSVTLTRSAADLVRLQGRIDGADISADLHRVDGRSVAFYQSRLSSPF
jgi:hypothetical protein